MIRNLSVLASIFTFHSALAVPSDYFNCKLNFESTSPNYQSLRFSMTAAGTRELIARLPGEKNIYITHTHIPFSLEIPGTERMFAEGRLTYRFIFEADAEGRAVRAGLMHCMTSDVAFGRIGTGSACAWPEAVEGSDPFADYQEVPIIDGVPFFATQPSPTADTIEVGKLEFACRYLYTVR